jgi:GDP-D-mannose dehydratase
MLRPSEILYSYADVTKAAKLLGWSAKNKMADVVRMMLEAEGQSRPAESVRPMVAGIPE